MKGEFNNAQDYADGEIVWENGDFYEITNAYNTAVRDYDDSVTYGAGSIVRFGNSFYMTDAGEAAGVNPPTTWTSLTFPQGTQSIADLHAALAGTNIVTADVAAEVNGAAGPPEKVKWYYFRLSPFQAYSDDGARTHIGDPTANNGSTGVIDDTARYIDVTDGKYWANTHYTGLDGITVGTSYNYGDNIFYKGEHYVYVDHLSSDNPRYLAGADAGLSSMEKLIDYGAVMKLDMYIDTVGGGGNAAHG